MCINTNMKKIEYINVENNHCSLPQAIKEGLCGFT